MGKLMRGIGLTVIAAVVILVDTGSAQGWREYVDRAERFTINLPDQPAVHDTIFMGERDGTLPARVYTVEDGPRRYSITVVDYSDADVIAVRGSIAYAAWNFRKRGGAITYDAFAQVDRIEGHQLQITNADQSRTYVAIHLHQRRLYILEATVPPGSPPPVQFQQSLVILDEDGNQIRYGLDEWGDRAGRIAPEEE